MHEHADHAAPAGTVPGLPIHRKAALVIAALVSLLVTLAAGLVVAERGITAAVQAGVQSQQVLVMLDGLRLAERAQLATLQAYADHPSPVLRAAAESSVAYFDAQLSQLQAAADADRGDGTAVAAGLDLHELVLQRRREWLTPLWSATAPLDAAALWQAHGRSLSDAIDAHLQHWSAQERQALQAHVGGRRNAERLAEIVALLAVLLSIGAGYACFRLLRAQLTRPLEHLATVIDRVARGDYSPDLRHRERSDEIGVLARAIALFRNTSLRAEEQTWIKTEIAVASHRLQQAASPEQFADVLCRELTARTRAAAAAFYALSEDRERLELIGGYALGSEAAVVRAFEVGVGLVGQCARTAQPLWHHHLPDGYLRVRSGLGEGDPRSLALLPLTVPDDVLGVVELACFAAPRPREQRFCEELLPMAALAFDNVLRAQRTQSLLARSLSQAEALRTSEAELKAQQDRLRSANEALNRNTAELEARSTRLQTSEEELRAQTAALQLSNEELRCKTAELNTQNRLLEQLREDSERKAEALARASQYKTDFLANMSHELRTPLNSLLILSRELADNAQGHLSPEEVESARVIHDGGSNLLNLINDILDLSKVEAGRMDVHVAPLRLDDLTQSLIRHFRHVARDKGVRFEVELAPELPESIHTDEAKLKQILSNLLGNAFKFTRRGCVQLRVEPCLRAPLLAWDAADERAAPPFDVNAALAITVRDTGIGIPVEQFDKVFQAFEQGDVSVTRQFGGTGLGLTIARRLANLLGGDIALASRPGAGTTFVLLLPFEHRGALAPAATPRLSEAAMVPAAAETASAIELADDRDGLQAGDTVVLIAESHPAFARTLMAHVRDLGHRVLYAGDGESALALARQYRPSGMMLDLSLPDLDGRRVIEQLKAQAETRALPVHLMSAGDLFDGAAAIPDAVGFLLKPATREDIDLALARVLGAVRSATRRLLVVDDDPLSRRFVCGLLAGRVAAVDEAADAQSALRLLGEYSYDGWIVDLGLPDCDGFTLIERAAGAGRLPPTIVHSARTLSGAERQRLQHFTECIVPKGARAAERLLGEVDLFLSGLHGKVALRQVDAALRDKTVLVVDDDMRNVFALSKALRARGLKVIMAQDGRKAMQHLYKGRRIDLVLLDIMMPDLDGYETLQRIRNEPTFVDLPILALTAKAMPGDRERCLQAGASDYLSKPLDLDALFAAMHRHLAPVPAQLALS